MPKELTIDQLNGVCSKQVRLFHSIFGKKLVLGSVLSARKLAVKYVDKFDFDCASENLLSVASQEAYKNGKSRLWKAYKYENTPLRKTYNEDVAKLFAKLYYFENS